MAALIVLTPNPAVDVTYRVPELAVGQTVRVSGVARRPGGKGLNVVRVLAALGQESLAVLPLGGVTGLWIGQALAAEGIGTQAVAVAGPTRSTVTVLAGTGHPTVLTEPGPQLSDAEAQWLAESTVRCCAPGDVLVVSGSLPPGTGPQWLAELVTGARAVGAQVLVDTSGPALVAAAEAGVDLLKPNAEEAMSAVGGSGPEEAAARLRRLGAVSVVVSAGSDGLIALGPDGVLLRRSAVRGVRGNPTGAGDAATAGLALARLRAEPMPRALLRAAALGAAAVCRRTAGEVDPVQVRAFEEQLTAQADR